MLKDVQWINVCKALYKPVLAKIIGATGASLENNTSQNISISLPISITLPSGCQFPVGLPAHLSGFTNPFHRWFFGHNSDSTENHCAVNPYTVVILLQIFTHAMTAYAVMACAKFCSNHLMENWMKLRWNLHHNWMGMGKTIEMGSMFALHHLPMVSEIIWTRLRK